MTTAAAQKLLEKYLEHLYGLCYPPSASGRILENLQNGVTPSGGGGGQNSTETRLLRLATTLGRLRLTPEEIKTAAVYHWGVGGLKIDMTPDGKEVVNQEVSGVDHKKAAKLMGIRGKNPTRDAKRAYFKVLRKVMKSCG